MSATFKTIRDYLYQENKVFVIPNYQRGYKWAVKYKGKDNEEMPSAVEKLLDDLLKAQENFENNPQSYFIQGITISEDKENIILIDGQQRTTTLYLLFWYLDKNYISNIKLSYDIRKESREYIDNLREKADFDSESGSDDYQDIYYFKQAIIQIHNKLNGRDFEFNKKFYEFILDNVNILYIKIDSDKATKTFTMMNGSKATMRHEELVKADMLRKISLPDVIEKKVSTSIDDNLSELKEIVAKDWDTNALRSRYAREWDKWLYWWNREDIITFFDTKKKPIGLLLEYYYNQIDNAKKEFNFDNFKALLFDKKATKEHFKGLRDLQKSFEDIYNNSLIYNYLGFSLINVGDDKFNTINYFIENKHSVSLLADFAKWRVVGATFRQITKSEDLRENDDSKESKAQNAIDSMGSKFVYNSEGDGYARKYLLYLNILEDNKLNDKKGRKFDFSIFGNQSLEHIHPKSKAFHKEEDGFYDGNNELLEENPPHGAEWLDRDKCSQNVSEHSIGNLVLLDKNENSKFGNSTFQEKKNIYFDINIDFKSRNLLHTISVFAKECWEAKDIEENQNKFIARFEENYKVKLNVSGGNENE